MPKAAAKEKAPKAAAKKGKAPAKSPAKAKKEKKEKDPNAPKRPLGAYFLFSNDMRAKVSPGGMTAALSGLLRLEGRVITSKLNVLHLLGAPAAVAAS
jgi:hypothetical protein